MGLGLTQSIFQNVSIDTCTWELKLERIVDLTQTERRKSKVLGHKEQLASPVPALQDKQKTGSKRARNFYSSSEEDNEMERPKTPERSGFSAINSGMQSPKKKICLV